MEIAKSRYMERILEYVCCCATISLMSLGNKGFVCALTIVELILLATRTNTQAFRNVRVTQFDPYHS